MSSRKKTTERKLIDAVECKGAEALTGRIDLSHWNDTVAKEDERDAGFKDGMHAASCLVDEVLQAVRVDTENAALDPIAETAAKLTIEAISRLWYERKGAL